MKLNNETIRTAVKEWLENSKEAEAKYGHISDWDVSNVTDMESLFYNAESFNQDIGNWNLSNVKDMYAMFANAKSFNQDIGKWDVSNVKKMSYVFYGAASFNQDISNWDVSNVNNMQGMFESAKHFNQDLSSWDVSSVTNMKEMFSHATSFNQDIGNWDVSNVTNMYMMFKGAMSFNKDIGNWDVGNVTEMSDMFDGAEAFNQNLKKWKVNKKDKNKILVFEENENSGHINLDIEGYTYWYGEYGEDGEFDAWKLMISFGGSSSDSDGEHEIIDEIKDKLNCEHLIFTISKNKDGDYEYYRIINLPEIFEEDFSASNLTIEDNFKSIEDVVNYVKNLKTISYKKLNPKNEKEIDLCYTNLLEQ